MLLKGAVRQYQQRAWQAAGSCQQISRLRDKTIDRNRQTEIAITRALPFQPAQPGFKEIRPSISIDSKLAWSTLFPCLP